MAITMTLMIATTSTGTNNNPLVIERQMVCGSDCAVGYILPLTKTMEKPENITEKLIECVKGYRVLYDLSHPDYKNIRTKNKTWDEVGNLMGMDGKRFSFFSYYFSDFYYL